MPGVVSHRARKQSGGYQGGGGDGALLLRECSFGFYEMKQSSEMDGDDGRLNSVNRSECHRSVFLKWLKW